MKVAAFVAVALSGLALAAPSAKRAGTEWKDLSHLKYAKNVPVPLTKERDIVERAAASKPVKDNRNLKYSHDFPIPKKQASA